MRETYRWISIAALVGALSGCASATPAAAPTGTRTFPAPVTASPSPRSSGGISSPTPHPGPASSSPAAVTGNIVITRSGGLTGISQNVVIAPDGQWTLTDRRAATSRHGQLAAAMHAHLNALVTAPAFAAEAKRPLAPMTCNDGIAFAITVGDLTAHDSGCGGGNQPAVSAVIAFVTSVVGW